MECVSKTTNPSIPSTGAHLSESWRLYKRKAKLLLPVNLLPGVLIVLFTYYFVMKYFQLKHISISVTQLLFDNFLLIDLTVIVVCSLGAMVYILCNEEDLNIREAYKKALQKLIGLLGVSFSWFIIPYYWFFVVPFIYFNQIHLLQDTIAEVIVLAWIEILFLLLSACIFFIVFLFLLTYTLASFILLNEGKNIKDAFTASKNYVKGKWGTVFGRYLFLIVLYNILGYGISYALYPFMDLNENFVLILSLIILGVFGILFAPFATTYIFLLYKYLKASHEQRI